MSCAEQDNARGGQEGTKQPFWGVRGETMGSAGQQEGSGLLPAEWELQQGCGHPDTPSPPQEDGFVHSLCIIDLQRKEILSPCSKYNFN